MLLLIIAILTVMENTSEAYRFFYDSRCPLEFPWYHWGGSNPDQVFEIYVSSQNHSFETQQKRDAIREVGARINAVAGQKFDFKFVDTNVLHTSGHPDSSQNVIYEGDLGAQGPIAWADMRSSTGACEFYDADIVFNSGHYNFLWGTPSDEGEDYWTAGSKPYWYNAQNRNVYARQTAMHELLHAIGLNHEGLQYSYMNYGQTPWTNRISSKQVEPLPDDRKGLRILYPTRGTECDLAVTNTGVDYYDQQKGAAYQKKFCSPSTGTTWNNEWNDGKYQTHFCSDETGYDAVMVCPGEKVYVRYTVLNYSNKSVWVTERAYFSTDENYSARDKASPQLYRYTIGKEKDFQRARVYTVPNTVQHNQFYYIIPKLTAASCIEESTQNNWAPLIGGFYWGTSVYVLPASDC